MGRNLKSQWRFQRCWRELDEFGGRRENTDSFEFADGNTAARAHNSARMGHWMQDGWVDGWISELREYEVDLDDSHHRARIVAVAQPAAYMPNATDEKESA